jgi:hypothetical protein
VLADHTYTHRGAQVHALLQMLAAQARALAS